MAYTLNQLSRHEDYAKLIDARGGTERIFGKNKVYSGIRQFKLRGQGNASAVIGLRVKAYILPSRGDA